MRGGIKCALNDDKLNQLTKEISLNKERGERHNVVFVVVVATDRPPTLPTGQPNDRLFARSYWKKRERKEIAH